MYHGKELKERHETPELVRGPQRAVLGQMLARVSHPAVGVDASRGNKMPVIGVIQGLRLGGHLQGVL